MKKKRRDFLRNASIFGIAATGCGFINHSDNSGFIQERYAKLDAALAEPVLKKELFANPVLIESVELLQHEKNFICRVRSKNGAEGMAVPNNRSMLELYPVFNNRIKPFFIGKDACDLDRLLEEVYVFKSNYKMQNLALWVPLASLEFAILDMLGKIANKPVGELIGNIHHPEIAVYRANNHRGDSAEKSIEKIKESVAKTQAKAVKFKIGGRMSKNKDYPTGRTEKLIPMVREAFGDEMTIYADSNGSYDVNEAVRIGKILAEYRIDFYEEPVPFDWYEETKMVKDALNVPIAGGEQEPSMRNLRWLIGNDALDILQPDIFYFGGMVRSMKVARMAEAVGKTCVPHISNSGIGYLYMMHFVSAVPNAGPYHEFKGFNKKIPLTCSTSELKSKDGNVTVPTGPGFGVELDNDFVKKHKLVR